MSADSFSTRLAALLGEPVIDVEPCRWGFTNVTSIVTLASGRQVVLQQITQIERANTIFRLTHTLPNLLISAGVPSPRFITADLTSLPPLLVREYIPGVAANSLLDAAPSTIELAKHMGQLLPRLAQVSAPAWLDQTWADPSKLALVATGWLAATTALLAAEDQATLANDIAMLHTEWVAGSCFAHGDFCPVNAIIEQDQIVAMVDLELARVAGPYFDAAWWGWVVRYHHPDRWRVSWPYFLAAAGLPDSPATAGHVCTLQRLRCLELLATAHNPVTQSEWANRLGQTLRWPC